MTPEQLAAIKTRLEARTVPDLMEPIGGGNPYYHCVVCGITNVEITSRGHDCERDHDGEDIERLLAEVERLNALGEQLTLVCGNQMMEIAHLKQSAARGGRVFEMVDAPPEFLAIANKMVEEGENADHK